MRQTRITQSLAASWIGEFGFDDPKPSPAIAPQNKYDAAGMGRRLRGWNPPTSGPNRAIAGTQKLRDRSRDANRNDWAGTSGTQHWATNLIGTGIVPRLLHTSVSKTKKKLWTRLWKKWVKVSDADGVYNFYGQQTLAVRSWMEAGEVFARKRYRRKKDGLPVPLQIQVIEADFIPMLDRDQADGMAEGHRIRSGIELNRSGQRVAYWMYKEHPSDFSSESIDMSQLIRIPADQVMHLFEPKRAGQLRGVPEFSSILARLRNVADFDDAVLERQKLANLFVGFIKKLLPTTGDSVDPFYGALIEDAFGDALVGMQPGLLQELGPGEDVTFANPPEAGTTYGDYMRTQHLGTAAGQGLPYEIMSGDIANVSDRTLRVVIQEFRRYVEQRQWQVVIPMFCEKVRDAWVDQAILAGLIDIEDEDEAKEVEWAPHGWDYIHPVQDAQSRILDVQAGIRSRSSVISERGDDPEEVDDERASDQKREQKLGLNSSMIDNGLIPMPAGMPNRKPSTSSSGKDAASGNDADGGDTDEAGS